ncbi:MAG: peroxiredoxin-like family protein [Thermodesulfobacteriota bacterium]
MSLKDDIALMQKEMIPNIPEKLLKMMMGATEKLVKSGIAARAKKTGDMAPAFSLKNSEGEEISSEKLLSKGPLVINFYRGSWCPYCNLELKAFEDSAEKIRELGAELVSISPELREKSAEFTGDNPFSFQILSDEGNDVAGRFGLVFTLVEELRAIYNQFGIDLQEYNGNNSYELPMPATYVLGRDGLIVHAFVDADYTKREEPEAVVKVLQKIRVS